MRSSLMIGVCLVVGVGCEEELQSSTDTGPGTTDLVMHELEVTSGGFSCPMTGDRTANLTIRLKGDREPVSASVTLAWTADGQGWEETHSLTDLESSDIGLTMSYALRRTLAVTDDPGAQSVDTSTLFCTGEDAYGWPLVDDWTRMYTAESPTGETLCLVTGHDPSYFDGFGCVIDR